MKKYPLTKEDYSLINIALTTLAKHFDDEIYHHTVGCAIRGIDNEIYTGVNCDSIHGSCAEFITVGQAILQGIKGFDTIVAVNEHAVNKVYSPCGNCRQMLINYAPNIKVILNDENNQLVKVAISDLLPFAWKKAIITD